MCRGSASGYPITDLSRHSGRFSYHSDSYLDIVGRLCCPLWCMYICGFQDNKIHEIGKHNDAMPVLLLRISAFNGLNGLLLSLCIIAFGVSTGATSSYTSKTFHQSHRGRHNRDPYLRHNTQNLTELAAFASAGTGVVLLSVFNSGFSEMAAVRIMMHDCLQYNKVKNKPHACMHASRDTNVNTGIYLAILAHPAKECQKQNIRPPA